jgi:hypothetical protein
MIRTKAVVVAVEQTPHAFGTSVASGSPRSFQKKMSCHADPTDPPSSD